MPPKDREGRFACPADVLAAVQPFSAGAALARLSSAKDHQAEPQRPVKSSGGERGTTGPLTTTLVPAPVKRYPMGPIG